MAIAMHEAKGKESRQTVSEVSSLAKGLSQFEGEKFGKE